MLQHAVAIRSTDSLVFEFDKASPGPSARLPFIYPTDGGSVDSLAIMLRSNLIPGDILICEDIMIEK